ncbi:MAG TPA: hypothetical protein VFN30_01695 [Chitinophagaceae bacterium]|nr:hypothetical protein [Chitinophagaceae bacterium]
MKKLSYLILVLIVIFSCQKEYSFEQVGSSTPASAEFSFSGSPGNCTVATVAGYYATGIMLTDANTVTIQVSVTKAGSYNISTNIVNGYSFSGAGIFTNTGIQTVTLKASGNPATAGTDLFTPQTGGITGCKFNVTVNTPSPAEFTLSGAPNDCSNATVNGIYNINMPLTTSNTVSLQVNVTSVGTYTLSTNTVGGISFSKTGSFGSTGIQTITLTGSGTPTIAGNNSFTPQIGTSSCSFIVNVNSPAVFSFSGGTGTCASATINGSYTTTAPLTSTNTVTLTVNVTTAGSYNITTNTVGGMTFAATGIFSSTGTQTVTLTGSGTPTTVGNNTLTVSGGCSFVVNVTNTPTSATVYQCKIDGALTIFTDMADAQTLNKLFNPPIPTLQLGGFAASPSGSDPPEFNIYINKNDGSAVGTGTYNEKNLAALNGYQIAINYYKINPDMSVTVWNTSSNILTANPPFTITVTSVTSTRVKGIFSGQLTNIFEGSTNTINITEGVFDLPIVN